VTGGHVRAGVGTGAGRGPGTGGSAGAGHTALHGGITSRCAGRRSGTGRRPFTRRVARTSGLIGTRGCTRAGRRAHTSGVAMACRHVGAGKRTRTRRIATAGGLTGAGNHHTSDTAGRGAFAGHRATTGRRAFAGYGAGTGRKPLQGGQGIGIRRLRSDRYGLGRGAGVVKLLD
jgi:hypothetical protein